MSKLFEAVDNLDNYTADLKSVLNSVIKKFNEELPALDLKINGNIDEILEDLELYLEEVEINRSEDYSSNYDSFNIQGEITWSDGIEQAVADYVVESLDDNDFFTTSNSITSDEDPVAFDKETELGKLHADDIYYEIAEFLHIDPNSGDFESTLESMKNRLDELDLTPEKYLELLKQYQADGKNVNDVLDDIEFND